MLRIVTVVFKNYLDLPDFYKSLCEKIEIPSELYIWDNSPSSLYNQRPRLEGSIPVRFLGNGENLGFGTGINNSCFEKAVNLNRSPNSFLILNPDTSLLDSISSEILKKWMSLGGIVGLGVFSDTEKKIRQASARSFPSVATGLTHRTGILTRIWPENPWSRKYLGQSLDPHEIQKVDWVSGCAIFSPAEIFKTLEGFDTHYFLYVEDVDLGQKSKALRLHVYFDPAVAVFHKGATSSKSSPLIADWYHHRGMLRYSWKWSGFWGRVFWPLKAAGILIRFFLRLGLRLAGTL